MLVHNLTFVPLGGRFYPSPLRFSQQLNMVAGIEAKLPVPYPALIWCLQQNFRKNVNFVLENGILVTPCFAILGKKLMSQGFFYVVWGKTWPKNVKSHKIECSTKWLYLDFWYISILAPELKISIFRNKCFIFQNFEVVQRTGIYVIKLHTDNTLA